MYWDNTFDSWQHFSITSQPAAVLVDDGGEVIDQWNGRVDPDDIAAALQAS